MQENPYPGLFIAVEGIDGSGKTIQAKKIVEYLGKRGYAAVYTKEPSYADDRQRLRQAITGQMELKPLGLQELFIEDRELHLEREIIPQIGRKAPTAVISDRYFLSTFAYGMAFGLSFEDLWQLHQKIRWFAFPDITIIIDTPAEEALRRVGEKKNDKDIFEKQETMEKVRAEYRKLAQMFRNDHVYVVDGMKSPDEVFTHIQLLLDKALKEKYGGR